MQIVQILIRKGGDSYSLNVTPDSINVGSLVLQDGDINNIYGDYSKSTLPVIPDQNTSLLFGQAENINATHYFGQILVDGIPVFTGAFYCQKISQQLGLYQKRITVVELAYYSRNSLMNSYFRDLGLRKALKDYTGASMENYSSFEGFIAAGTGQDSFTLIKFREWPHATYVYPDEFSYLLNVNSVLDYIFASKGFIFQSDFFQSDYVGNRLAMALTTGQVESVVSQEYSFFGYKDNPVGVAYNGDTGSGYRRFTFNDEPVPNYTDNPYYNKRERWVPGLDDRYRTPLCYGRFSSSMRVRLKLVITQNPGIYEIQIVPTGYINGVVIATLLPISVEVMKLLSTGAANPNYTFDSGSGLSTIYIDILIPLIVNYDLTDKANFNKDLTYRVDVLTQGLNTTGDPYCQSVDIERIEMQVDAQNLYVGFGGVYYANDLVPDNIRVTDLLQALTEHFSLKWDINALNKTIKCEPAATCYTPQRDIMGTGSYNLSRGYYDHNPDGLWNFDQKIDNSLPAENTILDNEQKIKVLNWKAGGGDTIDALSLNRKVGLGGVQITPQGADGTEYDIQENNLFSATLHVVEFNLSFSGQAYQLPLVYSKNWFVDRTADSIPANMSPLLLFWAGQRSYEDGTGLHAPDGVINVYDPDSATVKQVVLPSAFTFNSLDPTGYDPNLNYCDCQNPNNTSQTVAGVVSRFQQATVTAHLQGQNIQEYVLLTALDIHSYITNPKRRVYLRGQQWYIDKIDGYTPLVNRSTKVQLRLYRLISPIDYAAAVSSYNNIVFLNSR